MVAASVNYTTEQRRDPRKLTTTWRSPPPADVVFHPDLSRCAWEASLRGIVGNSTAAAEAELARASFEAARRFFGLFGGAGWANDSAGIDDFDIAKRSAASPTSHRTSVTTPYGGPWHACSSRSCAAFQALIQTCCGKLADFVRAQTPRQAGCPTQTLEPSDSRRRGTAPCSGRPAYIRLSPPHSLSDRGVAMKRLIVLAPAIAGGSARWQPLIDRLKKEAALSDSTDWLIFRGRTSYVSLKRAERIARDLAAEIDVKSRQKGGYDDIILVGHSFGGLLVRRAFLNALAEQHAGNDAGAWVHAVHRFVLFASINRGVNGVDPEGRGRFSLRIANKLFRFIGPLRKLLLFDLMRGSCFVTNLRIEWLREFRRLGANGPVVVQLLGTSDSLVKREDSLDVEQFPNTWHADVPHANHGNLYRLDPSATDDPDGRYALIRDAFLAEEPPGENRTLSGPDQVVFVLHGIRANNRTWVKELADEIHALDSRVRVITSSYRWFSALNFVVPATREKYVSWFQDQYADALAQNPEATFHFVGHSNGTYLFGKSLIDIPALRFDRAVLAGSVLTPHYDWQKRISQVRSVWNLRSNRDFPVSVLATAVGALGSRYVGPGGFEGFADDVPGTKEEVFWYDGGHAAALSDREKLREVAAIVLGRSPRPSPALVAGKEDPLYARAPHTIPWIARLLIPAGLFATAWWIATPLLWQQRLLVVAAVLAALALLAELY